MSDSLLSPYLDSTVEYEKINELGNYIFKEGHLDYIDDLLLLVLPILHITYYKQIQRLDDRFYAKEDLLQDAIMEIYNDMRLHWDKYIFIDNYPKYFEAISRNVMVNAVHRHHSYYSNVEFNADLNYDLNSSKASFDSVEAKILNDSINSEIMVMTRFLASKRGKYAKVLDLLITEIYENNNLEAENLKSRFRVIGIHDREFKVLHNHVLYLHKLSYNYQKSIMKGNQRMKLRIDDMLKRYESPTYEILSNNYGDSIIPEIFAEFGPDIAKKFVRTFSGQEVVVPNYQDFCDDLLGGTVYTMARGNKDNLYEIAKDNKLPYRVLLRMFNKVEKFYGGK